MAKNSVTRTFRALVLTFNNDVLLLIRRTTGALLSFLRRFTTATSKGTSINNA